uniref:mannosyl-oligosaccharide 1,3-1,6-alpha-mannosidase n=1 Tax=Caenorhabditis japonica TaxID=281687 RepID=A0A8R1DZN2_CAEJA
MRKNKPVKQQTTNYCEEEQLAGSIKPRTIWSNDPFGYSNSVPYLFKKSGVQRHVINRIHHTIKSNLQHQQAIPFKWRQFFDTTGENDVLTQVLPYTHYDVLNSCGSNPSVCCEFDFKRITHWACPGPRPVGIDENNVKEKAGKLVSELEHMAEMYKAPVILMMHGDDFRFDMIEEWHQQHDNFLPLFDEINKGDQVEIGFGTFNDYFTELEKWNKENPSEAPPTLSGDFFPYMCALGDYWTGYYTTRPFFKRQGRLLHSLIRNADLMLSMRRSTLKRRKIDESLPILESARRNLSLFQHHDAITGTSKVSVMDDYSELLHQSIMDTKSVLEELADGELDLYPRIHDGVEMQTILNFEKNSRAREIKIFNSQLFTITDIFEIRVNVGDGGGADELLLSIGGKAIQAQIEPYFIKGKVEKDSRLDITSNFEWLKVSGPLRETIYQSTDTVFQRTSVKNVPGPAGEQIDIALSIDISKDRNTELMTRFSTKWPSDKLRSYTDSVGLQLLRREFYNLPVEKNYYPMPTAAVIETEKQR